MEHKIDTADAESIIEPLQRFRLWQQAEIVKHMKELLNLGVVSPCESEWAADVVLVKKKADKYCLLVDARPL